MKTLKQIRTASHLQLAILTPLLAATGRRRTCPRPGFAPDLGGGTLQACIDARRSGEVVEIATNGRSTVAADRRQELTLRPAAASRPVFASPTASSSSAATPRPPTWSSGMDHHQRPPHRGAGGRGTFDRHLRDNVILDNLHLRLRRFEIRSGNTQPPYGPSCSTSPTTASPVGRFRRRRPGRRDLDRQLRERRQRPVAGNVIVQTGESTQNAVVGGLRPAPTP